jgi:hypothetical protein
MPAPEAQCSLAPRFSVGKAGIPRFKGMGSSPEHHARSAPMPAPEAQRMLAPRFSVGLAGIPRLKGMGSSPEHHARNASMPAPEAQRMLAPRFSVGRPTIQAPSPVGATHPGKATTSVVPNATQTLTGFRNLRPSDKSGCPIHSDRFTVGMGGKPRTPTASVKGRPRTWIACRPRRRRSVR